jgi:hypothetical protein
MGFVPGFVAFDGWRVVSVSRHDAQREIGGSPVNLENRLISGARTRLFAFRTNPDRVSMWHFQATV